MFKDVIPLSKNALKESGQTFTKSAYVPCNITMHSVVDLGLGGLRQV